MSVLWMRSLCPDGAVVDDAVTVFRGTWDGSDDFTTAANTGDDLFVFVANGAADADAGFAASVVTQAIVLEDAGALVLTAANFT